MRYAIVYGPDGSEKVLTYEQYIQSPEWANKRLAVLKGVKECQSCGRIARLDVHHRTYVRLGHEHLSDLVAICGVCHKGIHQLQKTQHMSVERATDMVLGSPKITGRSPDIEMPKMTDGRPPPRKSPQERAKRRKKEYKRRLDREKAETDRLWKAAAKSEEALEVVKADMAAKRRARQWKPTDHDLRPLRPKPADQPLEALRKDRASQNPPKKAKIEKLKGIGLRTQYLARAADVKANADLPRYVSQTRAEREAQRAQREAS